MEEFIDPRCFFYAEADHEATREVQAQLELIKNLGSVRTGCRIIKRPNCCILCLMNEDCSRVPLHYRCHCVPEPMVEDFEWEK